MEGAVGEGEGEGDREAIESAPVPVPVDEEPTAKAGKAAVFPKDAGPLTARDRRITTPSGIPALLAESMTTIPETEPAGP
jgi:hypothetical protein